MVKIVFSCVLFPCILRISAGCDVTCGKGTVHKHREALHSVSAGHRVEGRREEDSGCRDGGIYRERRQTTTKRVALQKRGSCFT